MTLVPWRPGEQFRDRNWQTTRPYLEDLGYPLFTGNSRGHWARAAACNAAAAAAGDWDIALVADADTILSPDAVAAAVARVQRTEAAARPHDRRAMLSLFASKVLANQGPEAVADKHLRSLAPGGGALVVHRRAWEAVGGYDERYVGWGYEDSAMNINLAIGRGWEIIPGQAWHLWHPASNPQTATARANRALLDAHRAAHEAELRRRSRAAGFDLNTVL